MGRSDLAIVIPAYNEEDTICDVISNVKIFGDIIVVDDCSKDETKIKVESTAAKLLSHYKNKGYESALSTGLSFAFANNYKYVVTFDADGEFPSSSIEQFLNLLKSGVQIIVGKRDSKNRLIESFFGFLTSIFFGLKDPLCGMKGYSKSFYDKYKYFDSKKMVGTELLAYSLRDKIEIKEVSVKVNKREGVSRFGGKISSFFKILRVIFLFFFISFNLFKSYDW
tara:strand:- start:3072 stop:3743 length:672 start_codon:yes stop_codon:yes gene_type:complete